MRLHDVSDYQNWKNHIFTSQSLELPPDPLVMDCATFCLYVYAGNCDFFVFDPPNSCHLGLFSKTDGDFTTDLSTFNIYTVNGQ